MFQKCISTIKLYLNVKRLLKNTKQNNDKNYQCNIVKMYFYQSRDIIFKFNTNTNSKMRSIILRFNFRFL